MHIKWIQSSGLTIDAQLSWAIRRGATVLGLGTVPTFGLGSKLWASSVGILEIFLTWEENYSGHVPQAHPILLSCL